MTSPAEGHVSAEERERNSARLWRIEGSLTTVLSELRQLEQLDEEPLRRQLASLERRWRAELDAILPEPLLDEMHRLFDWAGDERASTAELRVGLAQLEGWVSGALSEMGIPFVEPNRP
ncbi:MAG TPA: proteasome activator [Acidimicrobiales bacterium]|nr:proteasome activator [Acidimicrobiales bacterium]